MSSFGSSFIKIEDVNGRYGVLHLSTLRYSKKRDDMSEPCLSFKVVGFVGQWWFDLPDTYGDHEDALSAARSM